MLDFDLDFIVGIEKASLDFIKANAEAILKASPVSYIKDAKLSGTLFDIKDPTGSCVNTEFFVDHEEPLRVLETVRQSWQWPLGDLPEGHEYLLILPGKHCQMRLSKSKFEIDAVSGH